MNSEVSGLEGAPLDSGWVAVALLGKPRGLAGELFAFNLGDDFDRFESLRIVHLFRDARPGLPALAGASYQIASFWVHKGRLILKFEGIDTLSAAEALTGAEVRIPLSERAALPEGHFFHSDLIGCQVVDRRSGDSLGFVRGFRDGGGSGLLEVDGGLLLPFAQSICVDIDAAAKRIVVDLPEGLKDLNRP